MSVRCITASDGSPSCLSVNAMTIILYSVYGSEIWYVNEKSSLGLHILVRGMVWWLFRHSSWLVWMFFGLFILSGFYHWMLCCSKIQRTNRFKWHFFIKNHSIIIINYQISIHTQINQRIMEGGADGSVIFEHWQMQ